MYFFVFLCCSIIYFLLAVLFPATTDTAEASAQHLHSSHLFLLGLGSIVALTYKVWGFHSHKVSDFCGSLAPR